MEWEPHFSFSRECNAWIKRMGIALPDEQLLTRVIIDVQIGHAIKVYVERYGDKRILQVKPPDLSGAEIIHAGLEPAQK